MKTWAQKQLTLLEVNHDGLLENPPYCLMISRKFPCYKLPGWLGFPSHVFHVLLGKPPGFWEGPTSLRSISCASKVATHTSPCKFEGGSTIPLHLASKGKTGTLWKIPHLYTFIDYFPITSIGDFPLLCLMTPEGQVMSGLQGPAFQLWSCDILWLWWLWT